MISPNKKKTVRIVLAAAVLLAVILVSAYISHYNSAVKLAEERDFHKAESTLLFKAVAKIQNPELVDYIDAGVLLEDGDYDRAKWAFQNCVYYGAAEMILECDYQKAKDDLEKNSFDEAAAIFDELAGQNYSDSEYMAQKSRYQKAEALYNNEQYIEAAAIFQALAEAQFEDSEDKYAQCYFDLGSQSLDAKDYDTAAEAFDIAYEYGVEGSGQLYNESIYRKAKSLYLQREYEAAAAEFAHLIEFMGKDHALRCYSDSDEYYLNCFYNIAEENFNSGNYDEAAKGYLRMARVKHKDSEEKYFACLSNKAYAAMLGKNYREAEILYNVLRQAGYGDAEENYYACRYERASAAFEAGEYEEAAEIIAPAVEYGYAGAEELQQKAIYENTLIGARSQNVNEVLKAIQDIETLKNENFLSWVSAAVEIYAAAYENAVNRYNEKDYSEAQKLFDAMSSYKDAEVYSVFCSIHNGSQISESSYDLFLKNLDVADGKSLAVASSNIVYRFLDGQWKDSNGHYFNYSDDKGQSEENLPSVDIGASAWSWYIENGIQYIYTESMGKENAEKNFKLTVKSADTIEFYCYKIKSTYTLTRQ